MATLWSNMIRTMSPSHFGVGLLLCDKPTQLAGTQTVLFIFWDDGWRAKRTSCCFVTSTSSPRYAPACDHVWQEDLEKISFTQGCCACLQQLDSGTSFWTERRRKNTNKIKAIEGCAIRTERNQAHWFPWGWMNGSNASSFFPPPPSIHLLLSRPRSRPIRWPPIV